MDNRYKESSTFWNIWRSGHWVKHHPHSPPPQSFLKWWWPFIYWYSESVQKGSFELLCWALFPGVPHIFPWPLANKRQLKDEVGPCLFEVLCEFWLHSLGCPPCVGLSFHQSEVSSENSFGSWIRVQGPILPLHLPSSLLKVPEKVTAGFPH